MWISLVEGIARGEVLWMDFVDGFLSAEFSRVHDVLLLRTSEWIRMFTSYLLLLFCYSVLNLN